MLRILTLLRTEARDQYQRLLPTIIALLGATALGVLMIIILRPSVITAMQLCFLPWAFSGYRLFSIRRMLLVHITGEVVDVSGSNRANNNLLDNAVIRQYLKILRNIWLFQSFLFFGLPLLINFTSWNTFLIIPMVMIAVTIMLLNASAFMNMMKLGVIITVIVVVGIISIIIFPQIGYYSGISNLPIMSGASARTINEIERVRRAQIDQENNRLLGEALAWQRRNPGKELPARYQEVIRAAERRTGVEQLRNQKPKKTSSAGNTFPFYPNRWDEKNQGRQVASTGLEVGRTYEVTASGRYVQDFLSSRKAYGPEGEMVWIPPYRDKLPIPTANLCGLVGWNGSGGPFFIGKGTTFVAEDPILSVSINMPQNWNNVGHPSENFKRNSGGFQLRIRRL